MTIELVIQRPVVTDPTPEDKEIQQWMAVFSKAVPARGEVTVRIVDHAEITQLNRQYRNNHQATNVLSFPFVDPPGVQSSILGDIAICADVVATQAQQQQIPLSHHWAHMLVHGLLHLLGHDHQRPEEAEKMEGLEASLLALLQIPDPYANEQP